MGTFVSTKWLSMCLVSMFIRTSSESHAFFVMTMLDTHPLHSLVGSGPSIFEFLELLYVRRLELHWEWPLALGDGNDILLYLDVDWVHLCPSQAFEDLGVFFHDFLHGLVYFGLGLSAQYYSSIVGILSYLWRDAAHWFGASRVCAGRARCPGPAVSLHDLVRRVASPVDLEDA